MIMEELIIMFYAIKRLFNGSSAPPATSNVMNHVTVPDSAYMEQNVFLVVIWLIFSWKEAPFFLENNERFLLKKL